MVFTVFIADILKISINGQSNLLTYLNEIGKVVIYWGQCVRSRKLRRFHRNPNSIPRQFLATEKTKAATKSKQLKTIPLVGVIMGSASDWETMRSSCEVLDSFNVSYEKKVVSAHRTPQGMVAYAESAADRGLKIIIAGAGGAAHLPGMVASMTSLPVLGVPVQSKALQGLDSLLSIVQMPGGVPVGTMAIGHAGAKNAALLAVRILAIEDETLRDATRAYMQQQALVVEQSTLE
jgi:5-(carboxyamino)imidazole ribonucleotide mutase